MNEKKYILTDETINFSGRTLHRIQAVKDFGNVKAGDLGGWIESEENLSQEGTCWIFDDAKVFDKARVYDEAKVFDKARIHGEAKIFAKVCVSGEAKVYGKAWVYDEARIFGKARIHGEARLFGKACVSNEALVFDKACVSGEARVFDKACVSGEAWVFGKACVGGTTTLRTTAFIQSQYDFLAVEGIGSRNGATTFYKTKEDGIDVACGCFKGSIEEFLEAVERTHGGNEHGRVYRHAVNYAKVVLA